MDYTKYVSAELYVLIPLLYVIGAFIKNSRISDWKIPIILGVTGIALAGLWIFSTNTIHGTQQVLSMIFASITQGVMCAAASVYTDNLYKQLKEKKDEQADKSDSSADTAVG
ncbi:MAG: phage holin family protein [Clostridia bacterium]|nr:phage holin family protein [Clostridia bacterium]